jgi:uncharacterized protein YkwD
MTSEKVAASTSPATASQEFLALINQARQHPELYPPRGNTTGAAMTACSNALTYSDALHTIASEHNEFLGSQPLAWVRADGNAHRNPNGNFAWDAGEPIDQAGYHSFRGEIVADGFSTPAAALEFWMQDDGPFGWGHRNLILNCTIQEAGPAFGQYGPSNHDFYTVDMGTP